MEKALVSAAYRMPMFAGMVFNGMFPQPGAAGDMALVKDSATLQEAGNADAGRKARSVHDGPS